MINFQVWFWHYNVEATAAKRLVDYSKDSSLSYMMPNFDTSKFPKLVLSHFRNFVVFLYLLLYFFIS